MNRELIDLRRAVPRGIEAGLRCQVNEWEARLGWPRQGLLRNLPALMRRRQLAGWSLQVDGRYAGHVFLGEQHDVYSLELAWVQPAWRGLGHLAWLLAEASRKLMAMLPGQRLEIGLFPFCDEPITASLAPLGFQLLERDFMEAAPVAPGPTAVDSVSPWPTRKGDLLDLMLAAYSRSVDARASSLYTRRRGCRSYLKALTDGDECGLFEPAVSGVIATARGPLRGLVMGNRLLAGRLHLSQIAVHPDHRRAGLGSVLMAHFMNGCRSLGAQRVSLIASRENRAAYRWYRRLGFVPVEPYLCFWRQPGAVAAEACPAGVPNG